MINFIKMIAIVPILILFVVMQAVEDSKINLEEREN